MSLPSIGELSPFVSLLSLVAQGLLVWATWSLRQSFVGRPECDAHRAVVTLKLHDLELRLQSMPTGQQVTDLTVSLAKNTTALNCLHEHFVKLETRVDRHVDTHSGGKPNG